MTYATGADMVSRYDVRLLGSLVHDDSNIEPAATVPNHPNLIQVLSDASADIEAALFVGARYTPAQLAELSASAKTFLSRLCSDQALIYLKRRRGKFDDQADKALQESVDAKLKCLRNGDNVLMAETDTQAQASTVELNAPQVIPVLRRQTTRNQTRNYYPARRLPSNNYPQ